MTAAREVVRAARDVVEAFARFLYHTVLSVIVIRLTCLPEGLTGCAEDILSVRTV